MSKKTTSRILSFFLILLLFSLSIISFNQYQNEKQQWKAFIKHFYSTIDRTHNLMDYLIENRPTDAALIQVIRELEMEFVKANEIVISGNSYVDNDLYLPYFFRETPYLLSGVKMSRHVTAEIPPLTEDFQLDEEEVALLQVIRNCLSNVKQALSLKEENGPDTDITVEELNHVFKNNFLKSIQDIYIESRS